MEPKSQTMTEQLSTYLLYVSITKLLCCMPKTNTTLLINYTSILKNRKEMVIKKCHLGKKLNIDCGLNSSILLMANILILIMIV